MALDETNAAVEALELARDHWPDNPWATITLRQAYWQQIMELRARSSRSDAEDAELERLLDLYDGLDAEFERLEIGLVAWSEVGGSQTLACASTGWPVVDRVPARCDASDAVSVAGRLEPPPRSSAQVIAVGVDGTFARFDDPSTSAPVFGLSGRERLDHVETDARAFARELARLGYDDVILTGREATRPSVLLELTREVLTSHPGDQLIVYLAGHGLDVGGGALVVPVARDLAPVAGSAGGMPRGSTLGDDSIAAITEGNTTEGNSTDTTTLKNDIESKIHIIDIDDGTALASAPPDLLLYRDLDAILSHHRGTVTVIVDACLETVDIPVNIGTVPLHGVGPNNPTWLLGAGPGQRAVESEALGGGAFTRALLNVLDEWHPDEPMTAAALYASAAGVTQREVLRLHGVAQRPVVGDFDLTAVSSTGGTGCFLGLGGCRPGSGDGGGTNCTTDGPAGDKCDSIDDQVVGRWTVDPTTVGLGTENIRMFGHLGDESTTCSESTGGVC
ncbi:MAG: hypothetical protein AAGC60_10845 [Acidobacteriota bacterium]